MITYSQIKKLDKQYGSPFYILDEKAFRKNYIDILKAFKSRYPRFILAYSYKTNYVPYICKIIKDSGGFAEVVSRLEYELALKVGQKPSKIIFNGPVKTYNDIAFALKNKSIINLDSQMEIEYVKRYASEHPMQKVKIGIRININFADKIVQSHIHENYSIGRFGFDPEDVPSVIKSLSSIRNISINSLHGHSSSIDRSAICYEIITKTLCNIAERFFPDSIEYINIGGGIFGIIPPEMNWKRIPSFDDYAKAVYRILKNYDFVKVRKPFLVLEPGVAMAANALSFGTKVVSKKIIRGHRFITVDGSAFFVKPTFHKINQPYKIISCRPSTKKETYNVVGSTCMEKDYLLNNITDSAVEPGDYIMINNVGAYTVVLTPPFINPAPSILLKKQNGFKVIRKRQSLQDIFRNYLF